MRVELPPYLQNYRATLLRHPAAPWVAEICRLHPGPSAEVRGLMDQDKSIEAIDTMSPEQIAIDPAQAYGPWNPGIDSTLPTEFLPIATVFNSTNVSCNLIELKEISSFCGGLALERLSTFKPARLALHEVLIRVMADLSVPDGEEYGDLGINFRQMTATIMEKYIAPELAAITSLFEQLKREAAEFLDRAQGATASDIERPEFPRSNPSRAGRDFSYHLATGCRRLKSRVPNALMLFVSTAGVRGPNRLSTLSNEPATRRWSRPPKRSLQFMAA